MKTGRSIGIVNPGQMGAFMASVLVRSGNDVLWCSSGRSEASIQRAAEQGLVAVASLGELCRRCDAIFSVCPPHAAIDVAESVLQEGFRGLFVDANAISPDRTRRIAALMADAGIRFVDGGIIGNPAWESGRTWLYLSGEHADCAAAYFTEPPLVVTTLGDQIGRASAIKMCFAAYTKGSTALICSILGAADGLGVRDALLRQWAEDDSEFADMAQLRARRVTAKAWRFAGEMEEISHTFVAAGMPGEFHRAAGIIYQRLAHFKDAGEMPTLAEVMEAIRIEEG
ncbi:MAG: NAD(P)-dependent oxidoreductase [bacterium]|nr:NAD(P)-dependent oxidoreductase [bacterium]